MVEVELVQEMNGMLLTVNQKVIIYTKVQSNF